MSWVKWSRTITVMLETSFGYRLNIYCNVRTQAFMGVEYSWNTETVETPKITCVQQVGALVPLLNISINMLSDHGKFEAGQQLWLEDIRMLIFFNKVKLSLHHTHCTLNNSVCLILDQCNLHSVLLKLKYVIKYCLSRSSDNPEKCVGLSVGSSWEQLLKYTFEMIGF